MDLNSFTQFLKEPIVLVLLAAIAATAALLFLVPGLLGYIGSMKLPKLGSPSEEKPKVKPAKEKKPTPAVNLQINLKSKKAAAALLLALAIFGAGFVAYDFFLRPVRILSSSQLKLEKGRVIEKLQQGSLGDFTKVGIAILDVRSRGEYAQDHLVNSASLPAGRAVNMVPLDGVVLVIYSSSSQFAQARLVADSMRKNVRFAKGEYKKGQGRIFVVKDGFEGLKEAGFVTTPGIWD